MNNPVQLYAQGNAYVSQPGDQLIMELGPHHIACAVAAGNSLQITAIEINAFPSGLALADEGMMMDSLRSVALLQHRFDTVHVHLNTPHCVPVPVIKFEEHLADDFLTMACGEDYDCEVKIEQLTIMPGIVNIYRLPNGLKQAIANKAGSVQYHHTLSSVIKRALTTGGGWIANRMVLQFYHGCFILVIVKDGELHLAANITYSTSDDVMYHLLNAAKQLNLGSGVMIQASGLFNTDSQLYRDMLTHFDRIELETVQGAVLPASDIQYPQHYFAPLVNLAL